MESRSTNFSNLQFPNNMESGYSGPFFRPDPLYERMRMENSIFPKFSPTAHLLSRNSILPSNRDVLNSLLSDKRIFDAMDCVETESTGLEMDSLEENVRESLVQLDKVGIDYFYDDELPPTHIKLKILDSVASDGNCLFTAVEKALTHNQNMKNGGQFDIDADELRALAAQFIEDEYNDLLDVEEMLKMDKQIKNMYAPEPDEAKWGLSYYKTQFYIADRKSYLLLKQEIGNLISAGVSELDAKYLVYKENADAVQDLDTYVKYLRIGGSDVKRNNFFIISFNYSCFGLESINDCRNQVAWGDEFVLDALARLFKRDFAVVLLHEESVFILNHDCKVDSSSSKDTPIFLCMISKGDANGGDHYIPMVSTLG